jgi:D-alanine-D-alanine ligase
MKVGLVYNLRKDYKREVGDPDDIDAEWDSEKTIHSLTEAIKHNNHSVVDIGNPLNLIYQNEAVKQVDMIFNIAEGVRGRCRESQVPAICELLGIPYTFSDALTMALSLDKILCKKLMKASSIPTAPFWVISDNEKEMDTISEREFPLFVKPAFEGTAKGISKDSLVLDKDSLLKQAMHLLKIYKQPILVEKYLSGREFTVAIWGNKNPEVIGIMEIIILDPLQKSIYTFEAKEEWRSKVRYELFNDRESILWKKMQEVALSAYKVLGCRDVARIDIRCDKNEEPYLLEVNPIPGLQPEHSDFPMIAKMVGIEYDELIGRIIELASERYSLI